MHTFNVQVQTVKRGLIVHANLEATAPCSIDAGNQVLEGLDVQGNFKITVTKIAEVQHA